MIDLLELMNEVRLDFQNLSAEMKEVKQLQKEYSATLNYEKRVIRQTFSILKSKLGQTNEKSDGGK